MRRLLLTWLLFAGCLAVVLGAMTRLSLTALRLEAAEVQTRRQAAVEERVRLALWRMDSAVGYLLARENARPAAAYRAFYAAERAYSKAFAQLDPGDVLVPSPLLTLTGPQPRLHFQFAPDGTLSSPQVPEGNDLDVAEARFVPHAQMVANRERLAALATLATRERLLAALPATTTPPAPAVAPAPAANDPLVQATAQQAQLSSQELQARYSSYNVNQQWRQAQQAAPAREVKVEAGETPALRPVEEEAGGTPALRQVEEGAGGTPALRREQDDEVLRPLWLGDELLLVRQVPAAGGTYLQGCWLDWPALHAQLCREVADLLPAGHLTPSRHGAPHPPGHLLATLPAYLEAGAVPLPETAPLAPLRLMLLGAWGGVVLAAAALALLLLSVVRFSERRGAFVSAVTHELRTPLTTFRLYAEMLASGMVPAAKRQEYLNTLLAEAGRLGHMVENVLAYARLERGRAAHALAPVDLAALLARLGPELEAMAARAGMRLSVQVAGAPAARADGAAVERILVNLVDNAGKYARAAADKTIAVTAAGDATSVRLAVRDQGPGLDATARRRLFRPFSKSARDAAHSAPGIGLGLALSRRLARQMGGDLALVATDGPGACFELRLPAATGGAAGAAAERLDRSDGSGRSQSGGRAGQA